MSDSDKVLELYLANLVLPLVKDLVLPKVQDVIKKIKNLSIDASEVNNKFEAYLKDTYLKYEIIDTLTFPNKQTLFNILYEPLSLEIQENEFKRTEIRIDSLPKNFFSKYYRIIIEDAGGMGKSTILVKVFRLIIENRIGIPILIHLRKINNKNSILKIIRNQLSLGNTSLSIDHITNILSKGDFIFLLDGFDEIATKDKDFVIDNLRKFIDRMKDNYFLMSSRPEESLTSFGDFQKFKIKPLSEESAFNLIERYDHYNYKPIAKDLIEKINTNKRSSLKEYLSNPFLTSLLYKSFDYKKDIPIKKTQFYGQVFDSLFETHDLSKEGYYKRNKYSQLHIDDFNRVLRHLAYFTSIENKVEYDNNYIRSILDKVKTYTSDLNFQSSDFLRDLLETVPIFRRDGNDIKWAHKSLQDFFAAKFIWNDAKNNQAKILEKVYFDKSNLRFVAILELFYELDPVTFENTIIFLLLKDFTSYSLLFEHFKDVTREAVIERIERSFGYDYVVQIVHRDHGTRMAIDTKSGYIKLADSTIPFNFSNDTLSLSNINNKKLSALVIGRGISNITPILNLVLDKYESIVIDEKKNYSDKDVPDLEINVSYHIDSKIDNILNNSENFVKVTNLLGFNKRLSYSLAVEKIKEIEITRSKSNDEIWNW